MFFLPIHDLFYIYYISVYKFQVRGKDQFVPVELKFSIFITSILGLSEKKVI